jgi:hypothetical protein
VEACQAQVEGTAIDAVVEHEDGVRALGRRLGGARRRRGLLVNVLARAAREDGGDETREEEQREGRVVRAVVVHLRDLAQRRLRARRRGEGGRQSGCGGRGSGGGSGGTGGRSSGGRSGRAARRASRAAARRHPPCVAAKMRKSSRSE